MAPDQSGGTRHYDLARALTELGYEVTIIAAGVSHVTGHEERLQRGRLMATRVIAGVRFVWLRTPRYRGNGVGRIANMATYALMALVVQFRLGRPDVVIGSSVHLLAPLAALGIARMHKARFILEIRDPWPEALIAAGAIDRNSLMAKGLGRLAAYLYQRAEIVIVVTDGVAALIRRQGVPPGRILTIPHAVDFASRRRDVPADAAWWDALQHDRSEAALLVTYVGAHGRANDLDTPLRAARLLRQRGRGDIRLLFVGDGPERPRLEHESRDLPTVRFLGPVPKASVPQVLSQSDVGLATLSKGFWDTGVSMNKVSDYFAAGLPVVMVGDPERNPVSTSGGGVVIPFGDADALAHELIRLADMDSDGRRHIGSRGRAYAREHLSLPSLADKLAGAIDQVMLPHAGEAQ
jgi:glycosyltransferase involved in cell wall biosynthesis